jgi:hypothetical protein
MTNERYLVVSYFLCAALSLVLASLVYWFLRRSFSRVTEAASGGHFARLLRSLFPAAFLFAALLGFVSVSYQGCNRDTYQKVLGSREYLVEKNHEQISSTLDCILGGVLVWNLLLPLVLRYSRPSEKGRS